MTVRAGMVAFEDELFGPVIALLCAADEAEAHSFADQTPYGLRAVVFTRNE
jgi:succinate-semialdehyde dehydrogenase / glutarate-semialdehyde dehydrogenase